MICSQFLPWRMEKSFDRCSVCYASRCFNCDKNGHIAKDCPEKDKGMEKCSLSVGVRGVRSSSALKVFLYYDSGLQPVLLDTGSSCSIVEKGGVGERLWCRKFVKYADGKVERFESKRKVKVEVNGMLEEVWAYETKHTLPTPLLLGMDVLVPRVKIDLTCVPIQVTWNGVLLDEVNMVGPAETASVRQFDEKEYPILTGMKGRWRELVLMNIERFEELKKGGKFVVADVEPNRVHLKAPCSVYMRPIRYYGEDRKFLKEKFSEWVREGVCVPSSSRTAVSVVVSSQVKDGKLKRRACGNYKPINGYIVQEPYPMPRTKDIYSATEGSDIFNVVDFDQGHLRMPLDSRDRGITAVLLDEPIPGAGDHLEFTSTPWGLVDSARQMQRLSDQVIRPRFKVKSSGREFLRNLKGEGAEAFQDDILMYGKAREGMSSEDVLFENTVELFERLYAAKLMPSWKKTVLCKKEVKYAGFMISGEGVRQDPEKVKAIGELRYPRNRKELESVVGMFNVHRSFIPRLSREMWCLEELKVYSRNRKFHFLEEHRRAFDRCVELVKSGVMLSKPKGDGQFIVEVDACQKSFTVSAVLKQVQSGEERILGYASKRLFQSDVKKGVPFLEFSAIHYGVTYFKDVVRGRKILVRTDHRSLEGLGLTAPKGKWLSMYADIVESAAEVEYLEGKKNFIADVLSRLWEGKNVHEDEEKEREKAIDGVNSVLSEKPLAIEDSELKKKILGEYHDHFSDRKVIQNIRRKYDWEGITADVKRYRENECSYCLRNRGEGEKRVPMSGGVEARRCWQWVGIDVWPNLEISRGRKRHVGIAVCCFSGEMKLFSLVDLSAVAFLEKLEKKLEPEGNPEGYVGDSAKQFLGTAMDSFLLRKGAKFFPSSANRHQGNSVVENKARTGKALLHSKLKEGLAFKKALRETERICNQVLVNDGFDLTPFEVKTGHSIESGFDRAVKEELRKREELRKKVVEKKEEARMRQRYYYNKGKKVRWFEEGDVVMMKDLLKNSFYQDKRIGPFVVMRELGKGNYLISDEGRKVWKKVNVSLLEKCELQSMKKLEEVEEERKVEEKDFQLRKKVGEVDMEKLVGRRVSVWFQDKKKNFRGTVKEKLPEDEFIVDWDRKGEKSERVRLSKGDFTTDRRNGDRWSLLRSSV